MTWQQITLIIFYILYTCFASIDCYGCFKENRKIHLIFKCIPIFLITILSLIIVPQNYMLFFGFLFALIGDALILIKDNKKAFLGGATSFFIGHVFLFVFYLLIIYKYNSNHIPIFVYIVAPLIIVFMGLLFGLLLYKKMKALSIFTGIYYSILFVNLFMIIVALIYTKSLLFIMCIVGYLFFISSDFLIGIRQFKAKFKHQNFLIISTYFVAQLLISLGLFLLLIL